MASLICGTCRVKHENYDDLEACVLKHSEFIKNEIKEEPEELLPDEECVAYDPEEVNSNEDVETHRLEEIESVFVKSEERLEYDDRLKEGQSTISEESIQGQPQAKETIYKCNLCPFKSVWKYSLKMHTKTHEPNNYKFECDLCSYRHSSKYNLKIHMQKHRTEFYCPLCKETFQAYSSFRQHNVVAHSGKTPFGCPYCSKGFLSERKMITHAKRAHRVSCPQCSEGFSTVLLMRQHVREVHTPVIIYQCSKCQSSFTIRKSFKQHTRSCLKVYDDQKITVSEKTLYKQPRAKKTRGHMKTHKPKNYKFECHMCPYKAKHEYLLKAHLQRHKTNFYCPLCKETFQTYSSFCQHNVVHSGKPPVKCPNCSETFESELVMRQHVNRAHRISCPQCSEEFSTIPLMRQHVREAHPSAMNYQCSNCQSNFTNKKSLEEHTSLCLPKVYDDRLKEGQSTVSEESLPGLPEAKKPIYKCDLCPFKSIWKYSLGVHLKTHEPNNYKFECNMCPFKAKHEYLLKAHLQRHKTNFYCPLCNETFQTFSSFCQHNDVVHSGKPPVACPHCSEIFVSELVMKNHAERAHRVSCPDKNVYLRTYFNKRKKILGSVPNMPTRFDD